MQVTFKDDENFKQNPAYVKIDREKRNAENANLHTLATHQQAVELMESVRVAYIRSKIYKDVNKNSISIKVYKPTAADKLSQAVHQLNKSLEDSKVRITVKPTAITYHIDV